MFDFVEYSTRILINIISFRSRAFSKDLPSANILSNVYLTNLLAGWFKRNAN